MERDGKNYGMLLLWLFVGHHGLREIVKFFRIKKASWSLYGREKFWVYGSLKLKNLEIFCFQIQLEIGVFGCKTEIYVFK